VDALGYILLLSNGKNPFCGDMVQLAVDMNDVCYPYLVAGDLID
jgi:hypothetical protein